LVELLIVLLLLTLAIITIKMELLIIIILPCNYSHKNIKHFSLSVPTIWKY